MTFPEYIADPARRKALAEAVECNADYLWQIATKRRKASPKLVQKIEAATGHQFTRYDLRPDVYGVGPREAA